MLTLTAQVAQPPQTPPANPPAEKSQSMPAFAAVVLSLLVLLAVCYPTRK